MNQELAIILKLYAAKPHKELNDYIIGKSKDNLIGVLVCQGSTGTKGGL